MSFNIEWIKLDAKSYWLGDKWCMERCFMGPSQGTLSIATCKLPIRSLFIFRINFYWFLPLPFPQPHEMREEQTKAGAGGQDIGWLKGLPSDLVCHPRSLVELGLEGGCRASLPPPGSLPTCATWAAGPSYGSKYFCCINHHPGRDAHQWEWGLNK